MVDIYMKGVGFLFYGVDCDVYIVVLFYFWFYLYYLCSFVGSADFDYFQDYYEQKEINIYNNDGYYIYICIYKMKNLLNIKLYLNM